MKKKNVFLSKVFALALAASMALSTPYASAAVVTESVTYEGAGQEILTQSTAWWTNYSDFYKLTGDFDVTFEIANKSDGGANWNNVSTVLSNAIDYPDAIPAAGTTPGYSEYMVMRMDNWCWSPTGDNLTVEGVDVVKECDWNFDTFPVAMTDAKITLNVTRKGNDFAFVSSVVCSDGNTYNQSYKFTTQAEESVNIFFTGEKADVNILSYKINSGNTASDNNTAPAPDNTTGDAIDTTGGAITQEPDTPTIAPAPDTTPALTTPEPEVNDNDQNDQQDVSEPGDGNDADDTDDEDEAPVKKTAKLNKKKATVKVGKSVKLKVKNTSKKVTWSSSNKKVAKVSKAGKVTGVKAGKATIKAKVGGKTLKCKVTVK